MSKYKVTHSFSEGDKVTCSDGYKTEKGIVKSVRQSDGAVFVVFSCAGNWDNYKDYTAANTPVDRLRHGWGK